MGFVVATLSDLYHKSGAFIISKYSIFDTVFEDYYGGCSLVVPGSKKNFSWNDVGAILNTRVHHVFSGTYYNGAIPHRRGCRERTAYKIFETIKKIVRERKRKWKTWKKIDKLKTIENYNEIPILFYTDIFVDLSDGDYIMIYPFAVGKYFIAMSIFVNRQLIGYAIAQEKFHHLAGYQLGVAIFRKFNGAYRVANFNSSRVKHSNLHAQAELESKEYFIHQSNFIKK